MSKTAFNIAANENFESLRKVNEKIKKEKYFLDSNKKESITSSFNDKKFNILSNEFNLKYKSIKKIYEKNKEIEKNDPKTFTRINQLKALRNENNLEPIKFLVNNKSKNKIKIKAKIKKEKKKYKKVKLDNIQNYNSKNQKINCLNDEKIINIKIKLNPLNIRNNFNINFSNINVLNSMNQTEKLGFKYCLNNFDRMGNNFLSMRKTLDIFNNNETKKINHNNGYNPNKTNSSYRFIENNENVNTRYSKYFLPSSGFWLYSKDKNQNFHK